MNNVKEMTENETFAKPSQVVHKIDGQNSMKEVFRSVNDALITARR